MEAGRCSGSRARVLQTAGGRARQGGTPWARSERNTFWLLPDFYEVRRKHATETGEGSDAVLLEKTWHWHGLIQKR